MGRHWNAVKKYVNTGDDSGLEQFHGVSVGGRALETRWLVLLVWAWQRELSYESIYEEPV